MIYLMKQSLFFSFFLLCFSTIFSQSPEAINYQAIVRDGAGAIIPNQSVGIQISILQGSAAGTTVYQETFTPTTNTFGLVTLQIGTGTTQTGSFSSIDWGLGPYFVETAVDVTGGTNYVVISTTQFMSVPYALHAKTVDTTYLNNAINTTSTDDQNISGSSLNGTDLTIGIENGNSETVDLSALKDGVDDADNDPTNELQDWLSLPGIPPNIDLDQNDDFSGNYNDLTNKPDLSQYLTTDTTLNETEVDAMVSNNGYLTAELDGDSTNELQTLSISNDTIFLSDGGFAKLPNSNSSNNNSIHSYAEFSNTGSLTNWIVPIGISLVEISVAGSSGGSGGDIVHSANGSVYPGYHGGDAGYVSCLIYVSPGDTIQYLLGENGIKGSDLSCAGNTCCGNQAGTGTDGAETIIYHNSNEIINLLGGKGGDGRGNSSNSGCSDLPNTGSQQGSLDTTNLLSSGIFILNRTDDLYNLGSNKILLRY